MTKTIVIFIGLGVYSLFTGLLALWTQSNINYWLGHFGSESECGFLLAWLVTFLLNAIIIGANILSEVVELFI